MISRGIGKSAARSVARSLSQFGSSGGAAPSYDTDAQTYITAVETADGQSLETGVKDAINAFVVGCKSDGIWTAIKASCILAGARTLTGALVPLVGTAPTNNNFVSGDYSRTAGLTGDGSTKYLDSNRANNADPQNDRHICVYPTALHATDALRAYIRTVSGGTGGSQIFTSSSTPTKITTRLADATSTASTGNLHTVGSILASSRSASASYVVRGSQTNETIANASIAPHSLNYILFAGDNGTSIDLYSDATLAFYSIGESLDLADLDARVTTLITDIGAALA